MNWLLLTTLLGGAIAADPQFKSRPDLEPPVLNITVGGGDNTTLLDNGLIFVSSASWFHDSYHGPTQEGPYIYDKLGNLVWTGYAYASPGSENFRVQQYNGEDVLTIFSGDHNSPMGHGHGFTTLYNNRYEPIRRVVGAGHTLADQHEFVMFNDSAAIQTMFEQEQHDLTPYGANSSDQTWIINNKIQKVNVTTNELLWEWSSLDHVDPKYTKLKINDGHAGLANNFSQAWHYFYMNAADVDAKNNQYLFSARSMCTIFKVDGETGEVVWQLGGPKSDFNMTSDVEFCYQHNTRFLESFQGHKTQGDKQLISFFDNAAHENLTGGPILQTREYSEGKIVELDTKHHTAKLLARFKSPLDLSVRSQGSMQVLKNDHVFINWGYMGQISEHAPNGTCIFNAGLGSGKLGVGIQNYRAFKFEWKGRPSEPPAIKAYKDSNATEVYVSWNGDTETKTWKFYTDDDDSKLLGQVERKGFETRFKIGTHIDGVVAKAFDKHSKQLVTTDREKTQVYKSKLRFNK